MLIQIWNIFKLTVVKTILAMFSYKVFKNQCISTEYLALKTPFAGNFWMPSFWVKSLL